MSARSQRRRWRVLTLPLGVLGVWCCPLCAALVPTFASAVHERWHRSRADD